MRGGCRKLAFQIKKYICRGPTQFFPWVFSFIVTTMTAQQYTQQQTSKIQAGGTEKKAAHD